MEKIVHPRLQHAKNCGQTFSKFWTAPNGTFLRASKKKDRENVKLLPFKNYTHDLCQNFIQYQGYIDLSCVQILCHYPLYLLRYRRYR